ncbi:MAG TPA: hypothetical protein VIT00_03785 [Terrimicrobiaceae bacterium]
MNPLQNIVNHIESIEGDQSVLGSPDGVLLVRKSVDDVRNKVLEIVTSIKSNKERFVSKKEADIVIVQGPYGCDLTMAPDQKTKSEARDFTIEVRFWKRNELTRKPEPISSTIEWFPKATAEREILWTNGNGEFHTEDELASIIVSLYAEQIASLVPRRR